MILMPVTLVPCLLVGFGYKLGEQDEKYRIDNILKKRKMIYEE